MEKCDFHLDYDANPNVNGATIHALASGAWVRKRGTVVPRRGLRHRQESPAHRPRCRRAEVGFRVKCTLATKLVNELCEAAADKVLAETIARYGRVDLLLIDELGYLELDRRGAEILLHVLTEEKASVSIASNESFSGWTKTFADSRLCAAIVDRLTFGGHIIETATDSFRLAHSRTAQTHSGVF